jgi:hypothetical protein
MEISDAFTTAAINAAGTNLTDEEEAEVRAMAPAVFELQGLDTFAADDEQLGDKIIAMCVLYFIAGRTHQAGTGKIPVSMSRAVHEQFLEFLTTLKE